MPRYAWQAARTCHWLVHMHICVYAVALHMHTTMSLLRDDLAMDVHVHVHCQGLFQKT